MNTPLLAHRFRVLEILDEDAGLLLAHALDVASKQEGWLLRLGGPGRSMTRTAVLFRLEAFGQRALCRNFTVDVHFQRDQELFFFLGLPLQARPLRDSEIEGITKSSRWSEMLKDWIDAGLTGGSVRPRHLWVDAEGPFLLPSAYCRPEGMGEGTTIGWHSPHRCRREILDFDRELRSSSPFEDRRQGPFDDVENPTLSTAMRSALQQEGAWMILRGEGPATAISEALSLWSEDSERMFFELLPFVGPRIVPRRSGSAPPVLLLRGSPLFAAFAESLARLDQAGWLSGDENLVLLSGGSELDEALRLYFMSAPELLDLEATAVLGARSDPFESAGSAPPGVSSIAQQILDLVRVARRPLSETSVADAFSLEAAQLASAALELWNAGEVKIGLGFAEELGRAPALILEASARMAEVEALRESELHQLLAATVVDIPRRVRWGGAWLRAEAGSVGRPAAAGEAWRALIDRCEKDGLGLLQYAACERLLAEGEATPLRSEDLARAAIRMAQEHRRRGEVDRADAILAQTLDQIRAEVDLAPERLAPLICDLVLERAHLSLHRSRFRETESHLRETLDRYRDHLSAVQRTRIYLDLSWSLIQMGRTRESMDPCNLSLRLVDSVRHPDLVARAYNQLGYAQYKESDYETSIQCFQRALVLRQQVGDDLAVARTYNNLSLSQRGLGQLRAAESSLRESLRLKRSVGDHRGAAASLLNLGFIHLDQSHFEEARRCGVECLQLAEELHHPETEAEAYGLLGEVAAGRGRDEEALRYLRRDLDICEATGHEGERLATLRRLVEVLLRCGESEEAAERLEIARELLIRQPSRFEAAMLDRLEGRLFLGAQAFDAAADAFGSAARVFAALRRFSDQVECLAYRARSELDQGRSETARDTLRELREVALNEELATLPEVVRDLEARLGPSDMDAPRNSPADLLRRAARLLREAPREETTPARRWLSTVASALGATDVCWLRRETGEPLRVVGSVGGRRRVPGALRDLDSDRADVGEWVRPDDDWSALRLVDDGWLCLRRDRGLEEHESDFVEALASALRPASASTAGHSGDERPVGRGTVGPTKVTAASSEAIIGRSSAIQEVLATVDTVARTEVTVLLLGENGTGKDLVARALHGQSARTGRPFVALNCASIPPSLLESELFGHEKGAFTSAHERRPGVFERASGGTIFLDEIGEMPLAMQAKMLRVLQERSFTRVGGTELLAADVRVIAATNRKLLEEVRGGRFRMDLYYRLNVVSIEIPPLRARTEDIPMLAEHFVRIHASKMGSPARELSREALARLSDHSWPGNVRELENVIKNALVFTQDAVIRPENLPESIFSGEVPDSGLSVEKAVEWMVACEDWSEDRPLLPRVELLLAHEAVQHLGNKTLAAKLLGITKPTLYSRLRRFDALYGTTGEAKGSS